MNKPQSMCEENATRTVASLPIRLRTLALLRLGAYTAGFISMLLALSIFWPGSDESLTVLLRAGAWVVPLGFVVMAMEALVFVIAPAELSNRYVNKRLPGIMGGAFAYVAMHGLNAWDSVVISTLFAVYFGLIYLIESRFSRQTAVLFLVIIKLFFWATALFVMLSVDLR